MYTQKTSNLLNIALWTFQVLIALFFLSGAAMKLALPIPKLAAIWPWTGQISEGQVRLLGLIDLTGAIGLLLPGLLRIKPQLIVWAAAGVILLMIFADIFHISRGEGALIAPNIVVIILAAVIIWGRIKKAPIAPKATTL